MNNEYIIEEWCLYMSKQMYEYYKKCENDELLKNAKLYTIIVDEKYKVNEKGELELL